MIVDVIDIVTRLRGIRSPSVVQDTVGFITLVFFSFLCSMLSDHLFSLTDCKTWLQKSWARLHIVNTTSRPGCPVVNSGVRCVGLFTMLVGISVCCAFGRELSCLLCGIQ